MTQRLLSASNYMLDAFLLSLFLVFIDAGTSMPLPFIWLSLNALAALLSFAAFLQIPYRSDVLAVLGAGSMSLAFFAGASTITFLLFSLAAIYRLHVHFSAGDEELDSDNRFLIKFILLFVTVLSISLINPNAGKSGILYAIAIIAVSFYVVSRLLHHYIKARNEGALLHQLLLSVLGILGLSAVGGVLVYGIAEDTRYALGALLGRLASILFWPLAVLMDKLVEFLNGLSNEEQKQQTSENMNMTEGNDPPSSDITPAAADFPFELILIAILLFLLFFLVLRLRKVKIDKAEKRKATTIKIERFTAPSSSPFAKEEILYTMVDSDVVRKAFLDFERTAERGDKGRKSHETVREWLKRMGWTATEQFYETYEFARYGNGEIPETKVLPFLEEIKKIKEKYLKLNV
ncbi:hypothetical protein B0H99_1175 [Planomicrobium soli]|uniref:DUF4129 domain-containing protein n=1 Tax=Planomicrobium soli TaxID=1176648 RepID=A0A2P8G148_9BACL|nr:hypothetical protein [Planomicrobium soli]PSL27693.1 hypothetical protein B0H99_1175 [Planomicrobium soli]